jgi:hypothetical protein
MGNLSTKVAVIIVVPIRRSPVGVKFVVKNYLVVELWPLQMGAPSTPKETVRKHGDATPTRG